MYKKGIFAVFCLFSFCYEGLFEYLRGWVKRKIFAVACERNSLPLKAFKNCWQNS